MLLLLMLGLSWKNVRYLWLLCVVLVVGLLIAEVALWIIVRQDLDSGWMNEIDKII